ncbi:hypothetical protein MMC09_003578 [Bachmanniomyces sp. S44760]|nr:hypothetical protein [Bachmanniomyces sp. S44760]
MRKTSEESIRTEFCDGPLMDDQNEGLQSTQDDEQPLQPLNVQVSDRGELIERLKRGESPTWVPNRNVEESFKSAKERLVDTWNPRSIERSPLLPAIEIKETVLDGRDIPETTKQDYALESAADIERPRSALHAGNFTEQSQTTSDSLQFQKTHSALRDMDTGPLGTSPTTPWFAPANRSSASFSDDSRFPLSDTSTLEARRQPSRNRTPSLGAFSSAFVLKQPTSPLVQQSNNADLDFSPIDISTSPDKSTRRHTLPPQALYHLRPSPVGLASVPYVPRQAPAMRREGTFPYQSHHQRRSLTSNWSLQPSGSPQTPSFLRSRRQSFASEVSPLQHASMVGSYEESILRGRMSTGPSKPLEFTAQIGVLGKGDCKPKFPAHVSISFPAVFYSWGNETGRNQMFIEDEPSPYVGQIDLEHSLPPSQPKDHGRRNHDDHRSPHNREAGDTDNLHEHDHSSDHPGRRRREKQKRRSASGKAPPGGSYRIPEQGQLQIMIKNPNKTAVKLFLVPYDLTGMESGTKTFIRQRSYSAGPIIDNVLTSKPGQVSINSDAEMQRNKKPTLRYLIHLNICCPSNGRFYLYHHIRVVFANRVPDNKEKLQNEIQLPEPRYSIYKPNRESLSGASFKTSTEKEHRRRSHGFAFGLGPEEYDTKDGLQSQTFTGGSTFPLNNAAAAPPIPPIPFHLLSARKQLESDDGPQDSSQNDTMDWSDSRPTSSGLEAPLSPLSDKTRRAANILSSSYRSSSSQGSDGYNKLNKGDAGYGGLFGRPGTPEPGEGILARRIRELGSQNNKNGTDSA